MKIGYPCIHNGFDCRPSRTFRLANFSESLLKEKIGGNLDCLRKILIWNAEHGLNFFRITSDLIPFGSHEVHDFDFAKHFKDVFTQIADIVSKNKMRISMHPGQYTILNSKDPDVVSRAIADLEYHCDVLDALNLDNTHKVQIHVGGVYGDKEKAMSRFISNYRQLPQRIKARLVVENDDVSYSVQDCLELHKEIGIPIIFDNLHHACLNNGESGNEALSAITSTWKKGDGVPMIDYSDQESGERTGRHRDHIDTEHFADFINVLNEGNFDADIMLEIKDKEKSALAALAVMEG